MRFNEWYALRVRSRREGQTKRALESFGYQVLLPCESVPMKRSTPLPGEVLPLFPGYLFSFFSSSVTRPALTLSNVIEIVGFGGTPYALTTEDLRILNHLVHSSGHSALSEGRAAIGREVQVLSGPLKGVQGRFDGDRRRLVVTLEILGRQVSTIFDPETRVRML